MSAYILYLRTFHPHSTVLIRKGLVKVTPFPAVQFPWLSVLTLLGVPAVVIFVWIIEHTFFATAAFGWSAFADLVLPLGACIFATIVFLVPNPMHALLSLLGVFFTSVLFYLAAGIAFVGLVFLIVYVGAVAVLFLFVIMLLNVKSLTAQDLLLQHTTQGLALLGAIILFYQLHTRVLRALGLSITMDQLRDAVIESTTGEAVLFYIRYEHNDINILTSLYTIHSPLFLVTTIILLAALLGAIILATVTTERSTTLADIHKYLGGMPALAVALPAAASVITVVVALAPLSDGFHTSELVGAIFMSMYSEYDRRDRNILKYEDHLELDRMHRRRMPYGRRRERLREQQRTYTRQPRWFTAGRNPATGKKGLALYKMKPTPLTEAQHRYRWLEDYAPRAPYTKEIEGMSSRSVRRMLLFVLRRSPRYKLVRKKILKLSWRSYARTTRVYTKVLAKVAAAARTIARDYRRRVAAKRRLQIFPVPKQRWKWRSERATALKRVMRAENNSWNVYYEKWFWTYKEKPSPVDIFTVGPMRYTQYLWRLWAAPFVHYWAWRVHAFTAAFFVFFIIFPLILVLFPWFMDDYDIVWADLKSLHTKVFKFVQCFIVFAGAPWGITEMITLLSLYPAAAINILLKYPRELLIISALYAYDSVLYTGDDFASSDLHEARCKFFRITGDIVRNYVPEPTEEQLMYRRRHPDRGRIDVPLVLLSQTPAPTSAASGESPVSFADVFDLLLTAPQGASCPYDLKRLYMRAPTLKGPFWWEHGVSYATHRPVTILGCVLIPMALAYAFSGLILAHGWRRVYGGGRISMLWHFVVLFVTLYLWAIFYQSMHPIHEAFQLMGAMNISRALTNIIAFKAALAMYIVAFALPLIPYFMYRNEFICYKVFDNKRDFILRRFVNYYLRFITPNIVRGDGALIDRLAASTVAEAEATVAADDLLQQKIRDHQAIEAKKLKFLIYKKKEKEKFDFDSQIPINFRSSTPPYQKSPYRESDYW